MREVHIALGLIEQGDKYLLQLRSGDPKIGAAGLIGCFGGKLEDNEDPKLTFCREIAEETTVNPKPEEVEEIGIVNVESDHQHEPVKVRGNVFRYKVDPEDKVEAKEGDLVTMNANQAQENIDKLTPATRAIFEKFIFKGE